MPSFRAIVRTVSLFATAPVLALLASPAMAATAVSAIDPGRWEIVAEGQPARAICLADLVALSQVGHGGAACARMVLASDRSGETVHYSCPGAGWGRTQLRVESSHSVRIDTQGIAASTPFAFTAQARRTGDCGGVQRMAGGR